MAPRRIPFDIRQLDRMAEGRHEGGCHVSSVIHDLCRKLDPTRFAKDRGWHPGDRASIPPELQTRFELGLSLEEMLGRAMGVRFVRNLASARFEEFKRLGQNPAPTRFLRPSSLIFPVAGGGDMVGTPDVLDVDGQGAVEEWKCTWISASNPIDSPRFWHFWVQLKVYCYMVGVTRGRLRVFFINGDYRPPSPLPPDAWEEDFSPTDLQETWDMVVTHARSLGWLPPPTRIHKGPMR